MSIQVNIFEAGSVPTAQELATLINELNTSLDESVTLTGEQSITGVKTFLGSKLLKFKQSVSADKLGFTLYDYQSKEVGNFEYDNKSNFRLLALGNYVSAANQEVECNIGFKIYNKLQGAAYRLLCPLAGNAKNSIPSLSETYTNFYMPLVFTNGAASVMADNNGKVDLSTLIGSSSGSGDVSGLATVATTGDYNDLLNRPILFSGNYNDLTNKPTLFSGSYGDLTDKPTLFSGDYNDLTNKPTIPIVDITKAQADEWYQPIGNYALTTDLFSGSYNDLTDKPALFSGDYTDLTNKPTIPTNLSDLTSDSLHRLVTDALISTWNSKSDFSGSYNDLTDKPSIPSAQVNSDWNSSSGVSQILNKPNLATVATSGSYNDLSDKPTIPTMPTIPDSLSDLSDDSTHRLVTDTEKTTWNNKSDFSGSYNDLTNKPTIPTVPTISTNITSDATSNTKTASPKAVKDFVEGKGYITQSAIDNVLLSTSEHAVQNRILYNELRITESDTSSAVTIDSVTNDDGEEVIFTTLDANDFATATVGGRQVSIFPSSQYSPGNSLFVRNCLGKVFVFESSNRLSNMDFFIAFDRGANTEFLDGSGNVFSIEWFTWFRSDEVQQITGTQYYYFRDIVVMDWDVDATVPSSTVKSLKQKIEELEARIEQISAQLQS